LLFGQINLDFFVDPQVMLNGGQRAERPTRPAIPLILDVTKCYFLSPIEGFQFGVIFQPLL
jgi:hypothetical protein